MKHALHALQASLQASCASCCCPSFAWLHNWAAVARRQMGNVQAWCSASLAASLQPDVGACCLTKLARWPAGRQELQRTNTNNGRMQLSQLPRPQPILRCLFLNSSSNPNVQPHRSTPAAPQDGELTDKNCSVSVVGKDTTFTLLEEDALAPYITGGCWVAGRRRAAVTFCHHTSWQWALPAATPLPPLSAGSRPHASALLRCPRHCSGEGGGACGCRHGGRAAGSGGRGWRRRRRRGRAAGRRRRR